mgnify:CR=1 FL=1
MTDPSSRRKLAAILSADVVGYSRLMAANEAATVETLKSYRDIIARLVVRRGGRVVNAPGDALLAEFPSAVEAVQAAIEIQTIRGRAQHRTRSGPAHAVPHWGQSGRCDRGGRRHDLWGRRQHRRAHGGPRRGRRRLHLLHRLRRRRRQACLTGSIFWASTRSRTLRSRSASTACAPSPSQFRGVLRPVRRCPTSRLLPSFPSST